MTKGKQVDVSSTWEISVRSRNERKGSHIVRNEEKEKVNYKTTYQKVLAKKITRMVNVKGESSVIGGKCKMEKTSPWPRTVTGCPLWAIVIVSYEGGALVWLFADGSISLSWYLSRMTIVQFSGALAFCKCPHFRIPALASMALSAHKPKL